MSKIFETKPITIKAANSFVKENHRHHRPTTRNSGKWAISIVDKRTNIVLGVAIAGNPVSATYMDGYTLEITRLCILESAPKGASSYIIAKCSKIWKLMGGKRILTYTLCSESGASMRGAGWEKKGVVKPHKDWKYKSDMDGKSRDFLEIYEMKKFRWELELN